MKWSPPFVGSTHTAWPIGDRPYLVVTDEARGKQKYWDSQFMWVVDIRDETNPHARSPPGSPIATSIFTAAAGSAPTTSWKTSPAKGPCANTVFITYFNAGLRAVDVSACCVRRRSAAMCRNCPEGQKAIQSNDVGSDEHGRIYLIDRAGAGMHILEYTR